jgi:hypothetical protein
MLLTSNKDCIVSKQFIHVSTTFKKHVYMGSLLYFHVQLFWRINECNMKQAIYSKCVAQLKERWVAEQETLMQ